ncbi:MAG: hypothetical protein HYU78_01105 [Rhodocyclales bacterium]|nr:hypothetical protein [Rhodocyclales bacterium]
MVKRLFFCLALLGASLFAAAPAIAADPSGERQNLHWRCWYDQQAHIHCLLDSDPAPAATGKPVSHLPKIVQSLRSKPSSFKAVLIRIPMYTDPYDVQFPRLLAEATMCGGRADCSVQYTQQVPAHDEIAQILLRHMEWPQPGGSQLAAQPPAMQLATRR